jgi:hypothetical protein
MEASEPAKAAQTEEPKVPEIAKPMPPPDSEAPKAEVVSAPTEIQEPPAPPAPGPVNPNYPLENSRTALEQFLKARNWKERSLYVADINRITPIMQEYYREVADGPIQPESIDYVTSGLMPDAKTKMNIFHVSCDGQPAFPVMVEEKDGVARIDWESFVEFKDLRLPKFFEKFHENPGVFRVMMARTHYFGSEVPNQENMLCFAVEPPVPGYRNQVWVDASNKDLLEKMGSRKEWNPKPEEAQPVVKLRWVKDAAGGAYVMLEDIVADNWRDARTKTVAQMQ